MTNAQAKVLKVIQNHWIEKGAAPSFAELQKNLGYKTLSAVHKHCMQLKKRGLISHEPDTQRSIYMTDLGEKILLKYPGKENAA
tara:strand:- start:352 stop:603 length:252 start_codon:yes stop_codon:yes gene_type:complete